MSDAADQGALSPHGTDLLPGDLSKDQLKAAPKLGDVDDLLIDDLTDLEDEAFAAALRS